MQVVRANRANLALALEVLSSGRVIIVPTETVYGLVGDSANELSVANLKQLKGSADGKMLQMLAANLEDVHQRASGWDARVKKLASAFWPGPLTLVLDNVGWRVPDHPFLRDLIRRFGRPLAATSANLSAREPALDCEEAARIFEGKIDLALDGGRVSVGVASSVARVKGEQLEILREGAISRDELMRCWEASAAVE